jgi:hypothetical protein
LTHVTILTLTHAFLTDPESEIKGLKEGIMFATELIDEDGIPI